MWQIVFNREPVGRTDYSWDYNSLFVQNSQPTVSWEMYTVSLYKQGDVFLPDTEQK